MAKCMGNIASKYLQDSIDVYSTQTTVDGHINVARDALYTGLPCKIYTQSSSLNNNPVFGMGHMGVYKILIPSVFEDVDVVVHENYILKWTRQGKLLTLQVTGVEIKVSHIELEAQEVSP